MTQEEKNRSDESHVPQALVKPARSLLWAWLLPVIAIGLSGYLTYESWLDKGTHISIEFKEGYGLKPGDALKYRGIDVGRVRKVVSLPDLSGIRVNVSLVQEAEALARENSRFWIVRPELNLQNVQGLETLVGANYLKVIPGRGRQRLSFVGLDTPPILSNEDDAGLRVFLQSAHRGSLRPGLAVNYRQVRIGTVLSVRLASDASAVESKVYIQPEFSQIIREKTEFWDVGGMRVKAGIFSGVSIEVDSAEALLAGGVSLATPPDAGHVVQSGHRFKLHDKAEKEWLAWRPSMPLRDQFLPPGAPKPVPLSGMLVWEESGLFSRARYTRTAWVLPVEGGILGPASLLTPPDNAISGSATLHVGDLKTDLGVPPKWTHQTICLLPLETSLDEWPLSRCRNPGGPEDVIVQAGSEEGARFISAARLRHHEGIWLLSEEVYFDAGWDGACVIAIKDGSLIGLLRVTLPRIEIVTFAQPL